MADKAQLEEAVLAPQAQVATARPLPSPHHRRHHHPEVQSRGGVVVHSRPLEELRGPNHGATVLAVIRVINQSSF